MSNSSRTAPDSAGVAMQWRLFAEHTYSSFLSHRIQWQPAILILGVVLAAFLPNLLWLPARSNATIQTVGFPGSSAIQEVRGLKQVPLSPADARFAQGFAGNSGRFVGTDREVVVRWINRETRQVQSSSAWLSGEGYKIENLPATRDRAGIRWAHFGPPRMRNALMCASGFMICAATILPTSRTGTGGPSPKESRALAGSDYHAVYVDQASAKTVNLLQETRVALALRHFARCVCALAAFPSEPIRRPSDPQLGAVNRYRFRLSKLGRQAISVENRQPRPLTDIG